MNESKCVVNSRLKLLNDTEQAQQNVRMMYANSMASYSIIRVIETKVMDVFECNTKNTDEQ